MKFLISAMSLLVSINVFADDIGRKFAKGYFDMAQATICTKENSTPEHCDNIQVKNFEYDFHFYSNGDFYPKYINTLSASLNVPKPFNLPPNTSWNGYVSFPNNPLNCGYGTGGTGNSIEDHFNVNQNGSIDYISEHRVLFYSGDSEDYKLNVNVSADEKTVVMDWKFRCNEIVQTYKVIAVKP